MTGYDRKTLLMAALLSGLAGFVDATGFLATGGFFLSFMSGNSTRFGVGIAQNAGFAMTAGGLIGSFLLGVIGGSLIGRKAGEHRRAVLLLTIATCLGGAALLEQVAGDLPFVTSVALGMIAFAMGAENLVFETNGEVRFGLTYMTGTLVKIGQRIANAIAGGDRWEWARYLFLWSGLICGGVAGALAYPRLGLDALWIPAALAAALAIVLLRTPLRRMALRR